MNYHDELYRQYSPYLKVANTKLSSITQMGELTKVPSVVILLLSVILQILLMSVFGENLITEVTKLFRYILQTVEIRNIYCL